MDKRHSLCNKIKSAKNWLSLAEDNFRDNCDLRGELDLLLAEAELQHLREQNGHGHKRRRHMLAVLVACCLFLASLGGWYAVKARPSAVHPAPAPPAAQNTLILQPLTYSGEKAAASSAQTEKQYDKQTDYKRVQPAQDSAPGFSKSEIRNLVRAAGQTLRGK